ncbi:MAG TPA: acetyl-CoA hydrolase/transferase C-terminal domain-containing protein [Streptosporangiaceae bacterium]
MVSVLESADDLDFARYLRAGDALLWAQACAEPRTLVERLLAHLADGPPVPGLSAFIGLPGADVIAEHHARHIQLTSYTGAGGNAALHAAGALDILPAPYSSFPGLIRSGAIGADVVLVQLSPPDAAGRHSLGLARDYLVAALGRARVVIGEVSPLVPWTTGGPTLAAGDLAALVPAAYPPGEVASPPPTAVQRAIAASVAGLIEDGATLQFGIGALPAAVLSELSGRRHLGVHSGLLPDPLVDLMEQGVVTGERKSLDRGLAVGGMLHGSRRLFDYADRNERIVLRDTDYTHAADVLAAQDRFVALNAAVEVDLSGQVNAEVARGRYIGAVGGAGDFLRGAARSRGGLPVVMLPARAGTASRIVASLSGPVSTSRTDAGVIVTEHGVADLRGLSLRQRAERMIAIADPQDRAGLEEAAAREGAR